MTPVSRATSGVEARSRHRCVGVAPRQAFGLARPVGTSVDSALVVHDEEMPYMSVLRDFKAFILRGNVVDLAVGVVIGVAFGNIVTSLVKDLITPLIAAIAGQPHFSGLAFTNNKSEFPYGDFINAVVSFLIVAAVLFFLVVRPMNWLMSRRKTALPADPTTRDCPYCLSSIPLKATRCAFCTSEVPAEVTVPVEATVRA